MSKKITIYVHMIAAKHRFNIYFDKLSLINDYLIEIVISNDIIEINKLYCKMIKDLQQEYVEGGSNSYIYNTIIIPKIKEKILSIKNDYVSEINNLIYMISNYKTDNLF